jgi:hypothetical protein
LFLSVSVSVSVSVCVSVCVCLRPQDQLRSCLADQSYRVAGLVSVDWRADLTVASSVQDAPLQPTVQLKLRLDTQPERGSLLLSSSSSSSSSEQQQQQWQQQGEGGRVKEVAFELGAHKLDVLVQELDKALALMEA